MRLLLSSMLVVACLIPMLLSPADARGLPLKGQLLTSNEALNLTTGNCTCDTNWLTFGVGPGSVRIDAALKSFDMGFGFSYAVRVAVLQGNNAVTFGQAACAVKQKHCTQVLHLRFVAHSRTIYYIRVEGPGAEGIHYRLTVRGNLKPLHCAKGCSF